MTIDAMADAFQTINGTVSGIISAPQDLPDTIQEADLPMAITLAGPGVWHGSGLGGGRKSTRTYVIRVFIAKEDSANFDQTKTKAYQLMEAFGVEYRTKTEVGGAPVMRSASATMEDRGFLRTIGYGAARYFGFELTVTVQEGS